MESLFQLGILLKIMDMVSGPIQSISKSIDGLATKAEKLQPVFDRFKDYGQWMAGAGVAGAIGLGVAVTQFANLEEAQLGLQTLLMDSVGQVGREYQRLNSLAENLGTALPGSTKDMIMMFTALREQGVKTEIILGGMGEAAAKFSVLMKVPFAQGATHVAKFTEALGIADKEAVPFMDILQRLKGAAGVNVSDLSESIKYSGAALKTLRIQGLAAGQDVSAAIGLMATAGIEGSQAGTNLAMGLSRMAEISHRLDHGAVKKMVGPLLDAKGIKLDFFDTSGNFIGIRNMIGELEKLRAINPQEQQIVLSKLFGADAARPLSVFINSGVAGFDSMILKMQNQADMQTKINTIMSGTKMQWDTLTGTVANLVAHVGMVVTKITNLTGVMGVLNRLVSWMDSWILANPTTAGIIAGIVIGVTALALAAGSLLLVIGFGGTLITKMIVGLGLLQKAVVIVRLGLLNLLPPLWSVTAALLANPISWIILGIVALGGLLTWLYTKFEVVRTGIDFFNFFLGWLLGNLLKLATLNGWLNLFQSGRALVATLVDGIKSMAAGPVEAIKSIFQKIRNLLPFSDAKEGPLSQLTLSGSRIMSTMGDGIMGAAPGLHRTMAKALAGAALTATVATNPASATAGGGKQVIIQQMTVQLNSVADANDFVQQLQQLVEGYDVN